MAYVLGEVQDMDEIDKKIVSLLQENSRIPLKSLGEQVFLSAPAVAARIEKLEKDNIIESYVAKVNKQKLGYMITAFISLEVEPTQKAAFYPFAQNCPNVLECNCIAEDYSMLMKVAFKNTEEMDSFIGKLQGFGKTHTQIVFSTPVEARGIDVMKLEEENNDEV